MTQKYKKILTLLVIGAAMSAGSLPCHGKELKLKSVHVNHIRMKGPSSLHGPVQTHLESTFDAGKLKAVTYRATGANGLRKAGTVWYGDRGYGDRGYDDDARGPLGFSGAKGASLTALNTRVTPFNQPVINYNNPAWTGMATAHGSQKAGLTWQQKWSNNFNNAMGGPNNGIDPGNK